MWNRRTFLAASGAGLIAFPLRGAPLSLSPAGLIFLTIGANGRAAKALVDTGGGRAIQLSEALAQGLGLTLGDTGRTTQRYDGPHAIFSARLARLDLADTTLREVEATVLPGDIETIARQIGQPFDAILGWPLLSARPFVIDYRAGSFELREEAGEAGLVLPLDPARPQPVTAGTLGGQAITFLIDTGAPSCTVDASLASGAAAGSRVDLPFTLAGQTFTTSFRVRDLSAMTRGLGARAVIGHAFLQHYRFTWRPAARAVRLV